MEVRLTPLELGAVIRARISSRSLAERMRAPIQARITPSSPLRGDRSPGRRGRTLAVAPGWTRDRVARRRAFSSHGSTDTAKYEPAKLK